MLLALAVVSAALTWLWKDYLETLEKAAIQQTNMALMLERHAAHAISNADTVLDRVRDEIRDHDIMGAGGDQRWPRLGEMATRLPVSGRLWIYRADGSAVMASHQRHSSNNAQDREYFQVHQASADVGLFVGETVVGKSTGHKVFNLSRRIARPDGSFGGVIMAAVDVDVFVAAVTALKLGESAAFTLVRSDGAIIMRYPDAGATGKRFNLKVLEAMATQPAGLLRSVSLIDGLERQIAFQRLESVPVAAVVSLSRVEILAPWRQRAGIVGAGLSALLLLAAALTLHTRRAEWHTRRAVTRTQLVMQAVAEGICGLDEHGRVAFINPAGARLLGYEPTELTGQDFLAQIQRPTGSGSGNGHSNTSGPAAGADEATEPENPILAVRRTGIEHSGIDEFRTRSGHRFVTAYTATRVDDLDGRPGVVLAFRDVSAVAAAQNALRDQKEFVATVLDSLSEPIAVLDAHGVITAGNASWIRFANGEGAARAAQLTIGASLLRACANGELTPEASEAQAVLTGIKAVLAGKAADFACEYAAHAPEEPRWFALRALPLSGAHRGAVVILQNVSERRAADQRLRESEEHFRMLAENMTDIVWKANERFIFTYINAADQRLRGFARDEVLGRPIRDTLTPEGVRILDGIATRRREIEASGQRGQSLRFDIPQRCRDGGQIWTEITSIPTYDASGRINGYQGTGRDISARRHEEDRRQQERRLLQEQALLDPLTGLHNRRFLDEMMPLELERVRAESNTLVLIMLDLDHFKRVNDTHGHAAGDTVLQALAGLLKHRAREHDLICRYGGEEFVVVMAHMAPELARQRIEQWRAELAELPIHHDGKEIRVTFSAGLASLGGAEDSVATLLQRADAALYRAKREGRNRVAVDAG